MKRLVLLLAACTGDPLGPVPEPLPGPVLRFVGVCERATMWRLMRDGRNLPPSGLWLFNDTDSLTFEPVPGVHTVEWSELDRDGITVQVGEARTDSLGAGRIVADCLSDEERVAERASAVRGAGTLGVERLRIHADAARPRGKRRGSSRRRRAPSRP